MSDGMGRSEHQIAGEICRLQKVVRSIGTLEGIPGIATMYEQAGKSFSGEIWFPDGVIYPCPTIDNRSAEEMRIVPDRTGRVTFAPSMHTVWLWNLQQHQLPTLTESQLAVIEPPFNLNSGVKVELRSPLFYYAISQDSLADAPMPQQLISA